MADIRTAWDIENMVGQWLYEEGDLATDQDLETAVIISLFTDRRARPNDPLEDEEDRRGWWGDAQLGSRLYLLHREKQTEEVRKRAIEYASEALAWLVNDGVALSVKVEAAWVRAGMLVLSIEVLRSNGNQLNAGYEWAWEQLTA